jgi:hypothetical protein
VHFKVSVNLFAVDWYVDLVKKFVMNMGLTLAEDRSCMQTLIKKGEFYGQ